MHGHPGNRRRRSSRPSAPEQRRRAPRITAVDGCLRTPYPALPGAGGGRPWCWLGVCVVDVLLVEWFGLASSLSECAGDVVAEDGVLGAEVFDLESEGVEAGGVGFGGGALGGGDRRRDVVGGGWR